MRVVVEGIKMNFGVVIIKIPKTPEPILAVEMSLNDGDKNSTYE